VDLGSPFSSGIEASGSSNVGGNIGAGIVVRDDVGTEESQELFMGVFVQRVGLWLVCNPSAGGFLDGVDHVLVDGVCSRSECYDSAYNDELEHLKLLYYKVYPKI
jgi:hypothetical protein